jgi:O-antigen/teichoic acid export membrane protein
MNIAVTATLVIGFDWTAAAPLAGVAIAAAIAAGYGLTLIKIPMQPTWNVDVMRSAFNYCGPLILHNLAGQSAAVADRLWVNGLLGSTRAGLYGVGAMVGAVVAAASEAANRAYVPMAMRAYSGQGCTIALRRTAIAVIATVTAGAMPISILARELGSLLPTQTYADAIDIVPFVTAASSLQCVYFMIVARLFFERTTVRFIPLVTILSAGVTLALAPLLILIMGIRGAALGVVAGQVVQVILAARLVKTHTTEFWPVGRILGTLAGAFAVSLLLSAPTIRSGVPLVVRVLSTAIAMALVVATLVGPANVIAAARRHLPRRVFGATSQ